MSFVKGLALAAILATTACGEANTKATSHNSLTETEVAEGWQLLFDGKTTKGWRNYKKEDHGPNWVVKEDALTLTGKGGGNIISQEKFTNFDLRFEWKISEGGNSGVFFHVLEGPEAKIYWTGPEFQLLDNGRGEPPIQQTGSLFALYAPSEDATNPVGTYNTSRIKVVEGVVEYWVNGRNVLTYDMDSEDFKARVAASKFGDKERYAKTGMGHIALQDHGDPVSFRNMKIKRLP